MKARFKCIRKSGIESFTVILVPVADAANSDFFTGHPDGEISIYPVSGKAGMLFSEGAEVTIDFGVPPEV